MESGERGQGGTALTLCGALREEAGELDAVVVTESGEGTEYRRGAVLFAVCGGNGAEFRLRPEIVAAAQRTPDATASNRGSEWVALRPRALDPFTLDRALAWLETAWRIAGELPEGGARRH